MREVRERTRSATHKLIAEGVISVEREMAKNKESAKKKEKIRRKKNQTQNISGLCVVYLMYCDGGTKTLPRLYEERHFRQTD